MNFFIITEICLKTTPCVSVFFLIVGFQALGFSRKNPKPKSDVNGNFQEGRVKKVVGIPAGSMSKLEGKTWISRVVN